MESSLEIWRSCNVFDIPVIRSNRASCISTVVFCDTGICCGSLGNLAVLFCKSALRMEGTCGLSCNNIGHAHNTIQALIAYGDCCNDGLSHCDTYIMGLRFVSPMSVLGLKIEAFALHGRLSSTLCVPCCVTLCYRNPRAASLRPAERHNARGFRTPLAC